MGIEDRLAEMFTDRICAKLLAGMEHVPADDKALLPGADRMRSLMYVDFLDAYELYVDPRAAGKKELSALRMGRRLYEETRMQSPYLERMQRLWGTLEESFVKAVFDSRER